MKVLLYKRVHIQYITLSSLKVSSCYQQYKAAYRKWLKNIFYWFCEFENHLLCVYVKCGKKTVKIPLKNYNLNSLIDTQDKLNITDWNNTYIITLSTFRYIYICIFYPQRSVYFFSLNKIYIWLIFHDSIAKTMPSIKS